MKSHVDFHSHILPGLDDGSRCVEESLQMLRMEAEQGSDCVIATPHFYANHDNPENFLKRRSESWAQLQAAMAQESGLPNVILGAEVHYFAGISDSEALFQLTIGQNSCIMIEMPSVPWSEAMFRELENIHAKHGITPILAHIDRYLQPFRSREILKRLEALPVLIQANGAFFLHSATAAAAMRMLKKNQIQLLGSDCHGARERQPNLGPAKGKIEARLGVGALEKIRRYENFVLAEG